MQSFVSCLSFWIQLVCIRAEATRILLGLSLACRADRSTLLIALAGAPSLRFVRCCGRTLAARLVQTATMGEGNAYIPYSVYTQVSFLISDLHGLPESRLAHSRTRIRLRQTESFSQSWLAVPTGSRCRPQNQSMLSSTLYTWRYSG